MGVYGRKGIPSPVRDTMLLGSSAVTPRTVMQMRYDPLGGRPRSALQLRYSTVAVRRVQSSTVPSSRPLVTRECRSLGLRSSLEERVSFCTYSWSEAELDTVS